MGNVDTNNTVLEQSKSPTNTTDVSNNKKKSTNTKSKERGDTDDTENKNKDSGKEIIESTIALTQVSVGKKNITSDNENTLEDTNSKKKYEDVEKIGNDNTKKGLPFFVKNPGV